MVRLVEHIQYNSRVIVPAKNFDERMRVERYRRSILSDKLGSKCLVAIIGAGPAGIYASNYLAQRGVEVVLFNRDITPGGLAEYGIFPDKTKLRNGLLNYFNRVLNLPNVHYFGNVKVGREGDISLDQLRRAGFQAIMVTTGAQTSNWLGLPGEDAMQVAGRLSIRERTDLIPGFYLLELVHGYGVGDGDLIRIGVTEHGDHQHRRQT